MSLSMAWTKVARRENIFTLAAIETRILPGVMPIFHSGGETADILERLICSVRNVVAVKYSLAMHTRVINLRWTGR